MNLNDKHSFNDWSLSYVSNNQPLVIYQYAKAAWDIQQSKLDTLANDNHILYGENLELKRKLELATDYLKDLSSENSYASEVLRKIENSDP